MNLTITAKKMQVPQSFSETAQEKINAKLGKFFGEDAKTKITLSQMRDNIIVELTVKYNGILYRAEQSALDKMNALDADIDKIIRQIRKNKTKVEKRLKESAFKGISDNDVQDQGNYEIIKHKKFVLRPMSVDEAILQMNMLGHTFFMFSDAESGVINVVYKRADGNYAVLEPDHI